MLGELFRMFFKLGFFAFGGPAAHLSMMREEVIDKKAWMSEEEFLELMGFTHLIPGPNSTEMALVVGYQMAGLKGLLVAGISFIVPAVVLVLLIGSSYLQIKDLGMFLGVQAVLVFVILKALFNFTKTALKEKSDIIYFILAFLIYRFFNLSEITIILIFGLIFVLKKKDFKKLFSVNLSLLFLIFLKIGSLLYGSGYVLLSFLQTELIEKRSIITSKELIDALAIGELTPGPVFTTATAIGLFVRGIPGALVASLGIFLPSFLVVILLLPIYHKISKIKWIQDALLGVNIAALALMFSVSLDLGVAIMISWQAFLIFGLAVFASWKFKASSIQLILLSLALGFILY